MTNKVILRNRNVFWIAFSFTKTCLHFSLNHLFEFGPTPIHNRVLTEGREDMRKGEVSRSFMTRQICSLSAFESFLLHRWAKSRLKTNIQPSVSVWLSIHKRSLCQKAEKHHTHTHTLSSNSTNVGFSPRASQWQTRRGVFHVPSGSHIEGTAYKKKWNSGSKSTPILIPQSTNTQKNLLAQLSIFKC